MLILHSILMRFTFTRAFVRLRWRNNTYSCLLICWAMCLATLPVRSNAGTISNLVHNHSYMMMRLSPEEQLNFVAQSAFKELIQFLQTLKQQHNKLLLSLPRHSLPLSAFQLIPPRQSTGLLFNLPSLDLTRGRPLLLPHDLLPISAKSSSYSEPDVRMTAPEMITLRGFDVELHRVVTEDCYVLTLHRIVHPNLSDNERRRPILLQHGLMGTSADFLMNSIGGRIDDSDNRSLAFHLAKLGYDVWLANSRGNTYSLNHTHMDSNRDKKYWQFSFDEMSKFDLPATIAHIQNQTGRGSVVLKLD